MRSWNGRIHGSINLFGHVHHRLDNNLLRNTHDVGIDGNNFFPYSWDQIIKNINERNNKNPMDKCPVCGNTSKFVTTNEELRCGICGIAI
jgi:ribosomal protein S27AE